MLYHTIPRVSKRGRGSACTVDLKASVRQGTSLNTYEISFGNLLSFGLHISVSYPADTGYYYCACHPTISPGFRVTSISRCFSVYSKVHRYFGPGSIYYDTQGVSYAVFNVYKMGSGQRGVYPRFLRPKWGLGKTRPREALSRVQPASNSIMACWHGARSPYRACTFFLGGGKFLGLTAPRRRRGLRHPSFDYMLGGCAPASLLYLCSTPW